MKRTLKGGGKTVTSKINFFNFFICVHIHTHCSGDWWRGHDCDVRVFARILKRMSVVNSVLPLTNLCTGLVPEYLVAIATIENVVQAFTVCKTEVVVTTFLSSLCRFFISPTLPLLLFYYDSQCPCKLSCSQWQPLIPGIWCSTTETRYILKRSPLSVCCYV